MGFNLIGLATYLSLRLYQYKHLSAMSGSLSSRVSITKLLDLCLQIRFKNDILYSFNLSAFIVGDFKLSEAFLSSFIKTACAYPIFIFLLGTWWLFTSSWVLGGRDTFRTLAVMSMIYAMNIFLTLSFSSWFLLAAFFFSSQA